MSKSPINLPTSFVCSRLSTRYHRVCTMRDCDCECHNTFNPNNYDGDTRAKKEARFRKVKRVG